MARDFCGEGFSVTFLCIGALTGSFFIFFGALLLSSSSPRKARSARSSSESSNRKEEGMGGPRRRFLTTGRFFAESAAADCVRLGTFLGIRESLNMWMICLVARNRFECTRGSGEKHDFSAEPWSIDPSPMPMPVTDLKVLKV